MFIHYLSPDITLGESSAIAQKKAYYQNALIQSAVLKYRL
jgi:hypothetical protein